MVLDDYIILLLYGSGILLVGVSLAKKIKNPGDMFAAGGRSPWWVSGLSGFMTMFSAGTFVVWGGIAFRLGLVSVVISACYGIAAFFVGWTLAGKWKEMGVTSAAEFLRKRYGPSIVQFYTWTQGLFLLFTLGGAVYALSLVVCTLVVLPVGIEETAFAFLRNDASGNFSVLWLSVFLVMAVIVVTLSGGLWAVLITDTLQFVVLTVSVLFVVPLIIHEAGGVSGLFSAASNTTADDAGNNLLSPVAGHFSWFFLFGWVLVHYAKIGGEWAFVQRFTCVPSASDARKSAYIFGAMYLFCPIFWMLPAIAFRTIMPIPETMNAELVSYLNPGDYAHLEEVHRESLSNGQWEGVPDEDLKVLKESSVKRLSERAYILACQYVLPPGMVGLMVAAMISATASMATTQLNVFAGAFTEEVFGRFLRGANQARNMLRMGRLMTFLLGLITLAGAIIIPSLGTFEEYIIAFTASLTFPLILPTIWGLFSRRVTLLAAWLATSLGITVSLTVKFGFQGAGSWFAKSDWAAGMVELASRNTGVADWIVGLAVPLTVLLAFEIFRKEEVDIQWTPAAGTDLQSSAPVKASSLPAKLVGWSLCLIGCCFLGLLYQAEGQRMVLGLFAGAMLIMGSAILFVLHRIQGGARQDA